MPDNSTTQSANRPLKVARIIARLNVGGPAIHVILLTAGMDPQRFSTTLISGREEAHEGNMLHLAQEKGVNPIFVDEMSRSIRFGSDIFSFIKIYKLLRSERPDIVHTHTAKAGTVGRICAFLARVPIRIHTFHGHVFRGYFGPLKSWLIVMIERMLGLITNRIIMVSKNGREELLGLKICSSKKMLHIPLGLELRRFEDLSEYRGCLRKQLGIPDNALLVGNVARLVPIKGLSDFLQAAKVVRENLDDEVHFAIVGVGELEEQLRQQVVELGLQDCVHFAGFYSDVGKAYVDMDLLVLSSYNEGLPVAIIEAMASGVPVVANRVGGVPELVQDGTTGFLSTPHDISSMAECITKVLSNQQLRESMGQASRNHVIPRLCSERLITDMENLYTELAQKKGLLP
jgi:glycosyltransferase involved in cell wall biosynthesis